MQTISPYRSAGEQSPANKPDQVTTPATELRNLFPEVGFTATTRVSRLLLDIIIYKSDQKKEDKLQPMINRTATTLSKLVKDVSRLKCDTAIQIPLPANPNTRNQETYVTAIEEILKPYNPVITQDQIKKNSYNLNNVEILLVENLHLLDFSQLNMHI